MGKGWIEGEIFCVQENEIIMSEIGFRPPSKTDFMDGEFRLTPKTGGRIVSV